MDGNGAKIIDIINGISQAYADCKNEVNSEPTKWDWRTKVDPTEGKEYKITDKSGVDGFGVTIENNRLKISYSCPLSINEIYDENMEKNVDETIGKIVSELKKRYKLIKKKTLSLKPITEIDARMEKVSNIRYQVIATKWFEIKGIEERTSEKKLDDAIKKFLDRGRKNG